MTVKELLNTLEQRKKGLVYRIWREANLIGLAFNDPSKYPSSPEEAMPELFPPKVSIKMPDFLKEKYMKRGMK